MTQDPFDKALENIPKYIMDCPVFHNWVEYKGETYFGRINYDQSIKSRRAMIDLSHCATRALNGIVIKAVQYDKKKFKKSYLYESYIKTD